MTAPPRRLTIDLRRSPLRVSFGIRPTVVVDGRTEPAQWGVGTWQVAADRPVEVTVFLFLAGIRFGMATCSVAPGDARIVYRAPALPFLRGRLGAAQ